MLEHYVLFAARPGREADLDIALADFSDAMTYNCTTLSDISWGRNTNPSGLGRGFTHGCLARIQDDGLVTYWNHPAHLRLLEQLDELCTERFAMDYPSGQAAAVPDPTPTTNRSSR